MDAIRLLKQDHRSIEALFKSYEATGDKALKEKQRLAREITKELSIHASIEEQFLYPAARKLGDKLEDQALEALEEHHLVKSTLAELEAMAPGDERFDAKVTVLMENVRHHVKEEEQDFFPTIKAKMAKEILEALGIALERAKKAAPTHPHPMAPDSPPGNLVSDALAKIIDSGRDFIADAAHSATVAVSQQLRTLRGHPVKAKSRHARV